MAQTGYTPISLYYTTTASAAPIAGNLVAGELAINTLDEKLYFKNSAGTVKLLANSAIAGIVPGTGVATALAVNVGSAGAFVVNGGALGTPSSGTITNLTGTASININGTVGATTPAAGSFTTLSASGGITNTAAINTDSVITLAGSGTYNTKVVLSGAGGGAGQVTSGADLILNAATAKSVYTAVNFANITQVSSTGLAVTGALSATGNTDFGSGSTSATRTRYWANGGFSYVGVDSTTGGALATGSSANALVLAAAATQSVQIAPNASVMASFSSTGLGLGVTPSAKLHVSGEARVTDGTSTWKVVNSSGISFTGTLSNHPLAFITNDTERARIDSSGNLGLGVTPSAWGTSSAIQVSAYAALYSTNAGIAGTAGNAYFDGTNWRYRITNTATRYEFGPSAGGSHAWYTAGSGTADATITFTQAMTLSASGDLLVAQTSTGYNSTNAVAVEKSTVGRVLISHSTGSAAGSLYSGFAYAGVEIGSITQSGTTAVAYNTTSDHRLKENVRPANAARFMDIEFVDFEWVDGRHDCGVIADQLQSVYPDLVLGEKDATEVRTVEITPAVPAVLDADGIEITPAVPAVTEEQTFPVYQQVNYTGLIGRMGTRVQQLQRTVDAQAALIAAMEARLTALESA